MGAHSGHSHAVGAQVDRRMLWVALGINLAFFLAEVAAGIVADSLALLSDAAHMLGDTGAIALALIAARLALRDPKGAMTFGLKRGEILSAQVNGLTLLVLGVLIVVEAVGRLADPPEVEAGLVLWVGLAGVGVNLAAAWALARANRASLNVEGAFQHTLLDGLASLGAALAAVVILLTDYQRADPIASLLVAALMFYSAWGLLRASGRVLLEAAPEGTDPEEIGQALCEMPGVIEIHDLHVWEVTSGFPALSAHVVVEPGVDSNLARLQLAELLESRFEIGHTTLQVEHHPVGLLEIEDSEERSGG
jgi:cobalt-zinc-cadmium efflux system protein